MIDSGVRGHQLFVLLSLALGLAASPAGAQDDARPAPVPVTIGYVDLQNDPRHNSLTAYGRLVVRERASPFDGVRAGIEEAATTGRIANAEFEVVRLILKEIGEAPFALRRATSERNINYFIVDLPVTAYPDLLRESQGKNILLFNISEVDDELRGKSCAREAVHVIASRAMLADALTQYLVARNWKNILVLDGPDPQDALDTHAFLRSVKKFGARIVAQKPFVSGNDPRQRESNNPALLTAGTADYDVVYVADMNLELARDIHYRTSKPRPLVGSIGLEANAWNWTWERNGGPQVNSSFRKISRGRKMQDTDWAGWMAVKMIAEAVLRKGATDFKQQRQFILTEGRFDGAKGAALSVRPWDQQLRQQIFLATSDAVAGVAPMPGFLHQTETLDTLGLDRRESACKLEGSG